MFLYFELYSDIFIKTMLLTFLNYYCSWSVEFWVLHIGQLDSFQLLQLNNFHRNTSYFEFWYFVNVHKIIFWVLKIICLGFEDIYIYLSSVFLTLSFYFWTGSRQLVHLHNHSIFNFYNKIIKHNNFKVSKNTNIILLKLNIKLSLVTYIFKHFKQRL